MCCASSESRKSRPAIRSSGSARWRHARSQASLRSRETGAPPVAAEYVVGAASGLGGKDGICKGFSDSFDIHGAGSEVPLCWWRSLLASCRRRLIPSRRSVTRRHRLRVRDPAGLAQAVEAVSDPNGPAYRQYVTPDEFAARYGADPAAYQKVIDW